MKYLTGVQHLNRHDRRAADSRSRAGKKQAAKEAREHARAQRMPPARADGRPLFFLVPADHAAGATCFYCQRAGLQIRHYKFGEVAMNDPANPPKGRPKGEVHMVCRHHLPEDAVIYDPRLDECQNKQGNEVWKE